MRRIIVGVTLIFRYVVNMTIKRTPHESGIPETAAATSESSQRATRLAVTLGP
jgi:hypothetical protein